MRKTLIFYLLFIIGGTNSVLAHEPILQLLDIQNGLSQNHINTIFRDASDHLWIGSNIGLNRFNGTSVFNYFQQTDDSTSLNDNYILRITEDSYKYLWIHTKKGYNVYDKESDSFIRDIASVLQKRNIKLSNIRFIESADRFCAYLNRDTLCIEQQGMDPITYYTAPDGKFHRSIIDETGKCMVIDQFLNIYSVDSDRRRLIQVYKSSLKKSIKAVHAIVPFQNQLFILIEDKSNDLVIFDLEKGTLSHWTDSIRLPEKGRVPHITCLTKDVKEQLWIGTDNDGVFVLDASLSCKEHIVTTDRPYALASNSIRSLLCEKNGTVWIGTYKSGLNCLHPVINEVRCNTISENKLANDINCMTQDKSGKIYFGTNGKGLFCSDSLYGNYEPVRLLPDSNLVVVSLLVDSKDRLWVGTYKKGLFRINKNGSYTHFEVDKGATGLTDNSIWSMLESSSGTLWIGTLNNGLLKYNEQDDRFEKQNLSNFPSFYINTIVEGSDKSLWIGTVKGVVRLNADGSFSDIPPLRIANPDISTERTTVTHIVQDSFGYYWISTLYGLYVYDPASGRERVFTVEEGLLHNSVFQILRANEEHLWITTAGGISRITINADVFDAEQPLQILSLNSSKFQIQKQFNEKSALLTAHGEIVFGGHEGFNVFSPDLLSDFAEETGIELTALYINNEKIDKSSPRFGVLHGKSLNHIDKLELSYDQNALAFNFDPISFKPFSDCEISYRLSGDHESWSDAKSAKYRAVFSNLSPGNYSFEIRIQSHTLGRMILVKSLPIHIRQPWWNTTYAWIFYVTLVLLIGRILLHMRRKQQIAVEEKRIEDEKRKKKEELDNMKLRFFTNIGHELRTPLTLIKSPIEDLLIQESNPEIKSKLQMVNRNTKRLLFYVNQLLDFRKIEMVETQLNLTEGDFVRFVRDTAEAFLEMAHQKNITLSVESNAAYVLMSFDADKFERILFNLLSNAFKFTAEGGAVKINLTVENNDPVGIKMEVSDSGCGISHEQLPFIFDRFYQATHKELSASVTGSGLGLSIVKEFVELHGGSISVSSEVNIGTCFTIQLTALNNRVREMQMIPLKDEFDAPLPEEETPRLSKKCKILVVEDNEDFRQYLRGCLDEYEILEAVEGNAALELLKTTTPDLIISDIMMPVMDGIEFCRKVKSDEDLKNIPVVLLTARNMNYHEIEGLQAGAEDYITKPFSAEVLRIRLRSLLKKAHQHQFIQNDPTRLKLKEIEVTPLDARLLQKVTDIVQLKMGDSDFSVEYLSKEIGISTVYLNKKITRMTGKTTIEFIRMMRLKKAAQLLQKSQMNISEIAYEVGYNNPKYFSRYFKEEYKILPSEYMKRFNADHGDVVDKGLVSDIINRVPKTNEEQ